MKRPVMRIQTNSSWGLLNAHRRRAEDARLAAPELDVRSLHRALPAYAPTPLLTLGTLAKSLGVKTVYLKDESRRFHLNAFKALGASYGMYRVLKQRWESSRREPFTAVMLTSSAVRDWLTPMTFAAASEGNHGRAVAWMAQHLGQRAQVFVPSHARSARIEGIRQHGADVTIVEGSYDDTVRRADLESREHGWQVIADFGYDDYTEIPLWIESGYSTMFLEIAEQLEAAGTAPPDLAVLQAGGGCFAAGAVRAMEHHWSGSRRYLCVESIEAACHLASALTEDGRLHAASGTGRTISAGLNCPTPSTTSWPTLRETVDVFLAIDDGHVRDAMRRLNQPEGDDPSIVSGESGAAGLGGLIALLADGAFEPLRDAVGLGRDSAILVINTEGDTDPEHYRSVVDAQPTRSSVNTRT